MTGHGTLKRPGRVHVSDPGEMDVRSIRLNAGSIGCTQRTFAAAIGISVKTLRNWEQRRRRPNGPARILLARPSQLDPEITNFCRREDENASPIKGRHFEVGCSVDQGPFRIADFS
jgi:transcriptional regulator with XRE-family HTH domain